jgi:DNA-binding CsgD family transcriptional regulator
VSLSPREMEILELVAAGLTTKEAAAALGVSASTIEWHISNILVKLEASSRAEAVATAMRDGLLRPTANGRLGLPAHGITPRRPHVKLDKDLSDVLDRVLDKGIVIRGQVELSVAGIQLLTMHARVVVVSIETYIKHGLLRRGSPFRQMPTRDRPTEAWTDPDALPSEAVTRAVEEYLRGLRRDAGSNG